MANPCVFSTGAARLAAEPRKPPAKRRAKARRIDTSGDETARSSGRPAVSRATRANKGLDAGSDTAATHAPKRRGRKAASRPAADADSEAVEEEAETAAELSDAAPRGLASKHRLAAAGLPRTGSKHGNRTAENASAAAELDDDVTEASGGTMQAAPKQKGRKKAMAAAEASNATDTNNAGKVGAAEAGVKPQKKRGRPAQQAAAQSESDRHVRQKRMPAAAVSKSAYEY